jgi:2-oxoglutarate dehydrogenase E2 component (dihydrolipoamide succinyltransferase)
VVIPAPVPGERNTRAVPMTRMRQTIARRLKEAQNAAAILTTFNELDMTNIIAMRKKHKDEFQETKGVKLGFMSAFAAASSAALLKFPDVNATFDMDNKQVIYNDFVDISVAVATPTGLVTPVVRDVHAMNFAQIEGSIGALGRKARDGQITLEDLSGGTFTISNGGVFGSLMGTPILNYPQSAILGMHATFDRPVAINGQVEIRPMMYIALTYDHRIIDGATAVQFLKHVKQGVENPERLVLGL